MLSFFRKWAEGIERRGTAMLLPVLLARGDFKSHLAAYLLIAPKLNQRFTGASEKEVRENAQRWAETQALIVSTDAFLIGHGYIKASGVLHGWERNGFSWSKECELGNDSLRTRDAKLDDILPTHLKAELLKALRIFDDSAAKR